MFVLYSAHSNNITTWCRTGLSWRVEIPEGGRGMPRGDKAKYTGKQKRQAEHIAEGYEDRGVPEQEAKRRAWATVNETTGGGKKSGSGRGKPINKAPARKGGKKGGEASAARPAAAR